VLNDLKSRLFTAWQIVARYPVLWGISFVALLLGLVTNLTAGNTVVGQSSIDQSALYCVLGVTSLVGAFVRCGLRASLYAGADRARSGRQPWFLAILRDGWARVWAMFVLTVLASLVGGILSRIVGILVDFQDPAYTVVTTLISAAILGFVSLAECAVVLHELGPIVAIRAAARAVRRDPRIVLMLILTFTVVEGLLELVPNGFLSLLNASLPPEALGVLAIGLSALLLALPTAWEIAVWVGLYRDLADPIVEPERPAPAHNDVY
jgi:hypothetical protein